MSIALFTNYATTTLAAGVAPTDTTIQVASGTGVLFPNPGAGQYFVLVLTDVATKTNHEIMWVTGVSVDTFTVVRGQEGTSARTWINGDVCFLGPTQGQVGLMVQHQQDQQQTFRYFLDTGGSANTYAITPSPAVSTLVDGMQFSFRPAHTNTGPSTIQVGGTAATAIVLPSGAPLPLDALVAGINATVQYSSATSEWILVSGAQVAPTQSAGDGSVRLANTAYADRAAGTAQSSAEAYSDGRLASLPTPMAANNNARLANTTATITVSFSCPVSGIIAFQGSKVCTAGSGLGIGELSLDGASYCIDTTDGTQSFAASERVAAGSHTVAMNGSFASSFTLYVSATFIPDTNI